MVVLLALLAIWGELPLGMESGGGCPTLGIVVDGVLYILQGAWSFLDTVSTRTRLYINVKQI